MSLNPPTPPNQSPDGPQGLPSGPDPSAPSPALESSRRASVTFRSESTAAQDEQNMLDPANQSLADALGVMMRLLQLAMIAMGALYVLSGFQSVKEYERGIRLVFGAVRASDLEPGFQWSPPFPIGELVKIDRGAKELSLDKPFWPFVPDENVDKTPDKMAPTESLKPNQGGSGSVITGDGNIAHTQWKATYHRENSVENAKNIQQGLELPIVQAAVMRGVVQACAMVTIDELLAKTTKSGQSIALLAKNIAQETLDRVKSGIVLDQVSLSSAIPPLTLRANFDEAQAAVAKLGTAREEALRDASKALNAAAGQAAAYLVGQESPVKIVGLIPQYEAAIAKGDAKGAEAILSTIDRVMLGEAVEIDGQKVQTSVSGKVTQTVRDAQAYRNEVVSKGRSDLDRFEAKLAQFKANPSLTLQREWATSVTAFYNRDTTEIMLTPPGTELLTLRLNRDLYAQQLAERARKLQQGLDAEVLRKKQLEQQQFKTNPLQTMPG
jgi:regulator of protease activity HflC (stomatin/prohibitin superfamily)